MLEKVGETSQILQLLTIHHGGRTLLCRQIIILERIAVLWYHILLGLPGCTRFQAPLLLLSSFALNILRTHGHQLLLIS